MSEPTRVTPELAARKLLQRERAEYARGRDFDRAQAELEACHGECTAPGSTRGGILLGDGTRTAGMVAVDAAGQPLQDVPLAGEPFVATRPCFDCNRERWEAWQRGEMASKLRRKVENAEDRKVKQQRQHRADQESFR